MPDLVDAGYSNNEESDDDSMPDLVHMDDVRTVAHASAVPAPLQLQPADAAHPTAPRMKAITIACPAWNPPLALTTKSRTMAC